MKITTARHPGSRGWDEITKGTTGVRRHWSRAWPQRAGVLALTVGIVLLVAACGGGSSNTDPSLTTGGPSSTGIRSAGSGGSSSTGRSTQGQQNLAFAQCMRSDGVTDFPDPDSNGQFGKISAQLEDSPQFGTSYNSCKHLLPGGGVSKSQQDLSQLLKFAQCMHAHGVPTYPEPSANVDPYSITNTSVNALREAGVNPNSPVVQAALRACERANPVGS
jgi:hypothetical protein